MEIDIDWKSRELFLVYVLLLGIFAIMAEPIITGLVTADDVLSFNETVSLEFTSSSQTVWQPQNPGKLTHLSILGRMEEGTIAKVYIEGNESRYLLFETGPENGISAITGHAVEENLTVDENVSADENSPSREILIALEYNKGSLFDEDDNGVASISEAIDFSVNASSFSWEHEDNKTCTRWEIYSEDKGTATTICHGKEDCCLLAGLAPSKEQWNEPLYLTYNMLGATSSNVVSAQIIHAGNETISSKWRSLGARFEEKGLLPIEGCSSTCILPGINSKEYTIIAEVEYGRILIDGLQYRLANEKNSPPGLIKDIENFTAGSPFSIDLGSYFKDTDKLSYTYFKPDNLTIEFEDDTAKFIPDSSFEGILYTFITANDSKDIAMSNIFSVNVTRNDSEPRQLAAEINKPVKWVRKTREKEIELHEGAYNITVIKDSVLVLKEGVSINEHGLLKSLDDYEKERKEKKTKDKKIPEENKTELIIEEDGEFDVFYETPAPVSFETNIGRNSKLVTISSELHYENVLAYTSVDDVPYGSVRLYWLQNGARNLFENVTYRDNNGNNLIDYIEWVVPHLSNQTFEVSITVLNVQSYPTVGGNWTVLFNTTGIGNLTIFASNGTTYMEKDIDNLSTISDLSPLELRCGNQVLFNYQDLIINDSVYVVDDSNNRLKISDYIGQSRKIKSLFAENYSCDNSTGYWTVKVHTPGKHHQTFNFSGQIAYANNLANDINNCTNITIEGFNFNLSTNVNSTATCINVLANNVTIDCHGFTINYSQNSMGYGINISGYNYTTIRSCSIVQNVTNMGGAANSYGIYIFRNASFNTVYNNSITTNSTFGYGILLGGAKNNSISNNTITTFDSNPVILSSSSNNSVYNNNINVFGTATGILLTSKSDSNQAYNNTITTSARGVHVSSGSLNQISHNAITTSESSGNGIELSGSGSNNSVYWNKIITYESSATGTLISNSNNSVYGNKITTFGNFAFGIRSNAGPNNQIHSNNITTSGSDGYGVYLSSSADNNQIYNNNITTSGSDGYGAYVSTSDSNSIYNNVITTLGGSGYGALVDSSARNNSIYSNNITVRGNYSYGIKVQSSQNTSFSFNNVTTLNETSYGIYLEGIVNNTHSYRNMLSSTGRGIVINGTTSNTGSFFNTFTNDTIVPCSIGCASDYYDVWLQNKSYFTTFLNVSFNKSRVYVRDSNITVQWYADVLVNDAANPINDASLNITNRFNNVTFSGNSDSNGRIATQILTEFEMNGTVLWGNNESCHTLASTHNLTCYSPYNLTANKTLYTTELVTKAINRSKEITISLTSTAANLNCTNITVGGYIHNLTGNASSYATCINILANNVTIDCHGYTINYSNTSVGYGINISGYNYTTIRSCKLYQGSALASSYGVHLSRSFNTTILNSTISTGGSVSHGINMINSGNNTLQDIRVNNSVTNARGMLVTSSNSNTIRSSLYYAANAVGIELSSSSYNEIYNNTISSDGPGNEGIKLAGGSGSLYNLIHDNIITTSSGDAATFESLSGRNVLKDNNITSMGQAYGVYVQGVSHNTIQGNKIITFKISSYGLFLSSSFNTTAKGNDVKTYGSSVHGIYLSNSANSSVSNNTITTNGSSAYGIYLYDSLSTNNSISSNHITTNGTSAHGLVVQLESGNNSIFENSITTLNDSSYGIYLSLKAERNIFFRNNISSRLAAIALNGSGVGISPPSGAINFNTFTNDTIVPCNNSCSARYNDILLTSNVTDIIFLNVSFNKSRIAFVPNNPNNPAEKNNLTVKWYLDINVTNSTDNNPIIGAHVVVNDSFSGNIFNGTTSATGGIQTLIVTEFEMNGTVLWGQNESCHTLSASHNVTCYSPYNISVNISRYIGYNNALAANRSKFLNISINHIPYGALYVNISLPLNNTVVYVNQTFVVIANVTCRNNYCGEVIGTVRYNDSASNVANKSISFSKGTTPLFINGSKGILRYNFGGVSYPSPVAETNATHGYHSIPSPGPALNIQSETEFKQANYTSISTENGAVVDNIVSSPNNMYAAQKFSFKLNESDTYVSNMTIFWRGSGGVKDIVSDEVDMKVLIWKSSGSGFWETMASCVVAGADPLTHNGCVFNRTFSNASYYINQNHHNTVYILAISNLPSDTGSLADSVIRTDHIEINVTKSFNPLSCGSMLQGDTCQLNWTINASGDVGSRLLIDVNFSSNDSAIKSNDTQDMIISLDVTPLSSNLNCTNITIPGYIHNLTGNASSYATCINVMANNVTIDCRGYKINYSNTSVGYGINVSGYNYTTIKSCNIYQADIASDNSDSYGLYISGSLAIRLGFTTIYNNSIRTIGTSSYGIYMLNNVHNTTINGNNVTTLGTSADSLVMLGSGGFRVSNNSVYDNFLNHSGTSANTIDMDFANENHIFSNGIHGWSSGGGPPLILIGSSSSGNKIYLNNITLGSSGAGFDDSGTYTSIYQNIIGQSLVADGVIIRGQYANVSANLIGGFNGVSIEGSFSQVYNNNITSPTGVSFSTGFNNMIYDNNITSTTNGVSLSGSNNMIFNNNINSSQDGASVLGSNNSLYSNKISTFGGIGTSISGSNNSVYNNNITTRNASSPGINTIFGSGNNSIYFNRIIALNESGSYGIYVLSPANNTFFSNLINSTSGGIMINKSSYSINSFTNDTIVPCSIGCAANYADVILTSNATDIFFLNVSFNKSRIVFVPNSPDNPVEKNNLTIRWYLDVNVTNSTDNKPIANAQVVINDSLRNNIFNGTTSSTGGIQTLTVTEFELNGTVQWGQNESCHTLAATHNITCYSPYNISVNISGYNNYNDAVAVNRSKFRNISMSLLPPSNLNCTNITIAGYIHNLTGNASSYATCINVRANNVTIDCKGYNINYSNVSIGYGINVSGYNRTVIKSCSIVQGSNLGSFSDGAYGIYLFNNSQNSTAFNNTIATSGVFSFGIFISSSHNNLIHNNKINTTGENGIAIAIAYNSTNNVIYTNVMATNSTTGYGIFISNSSSNNIYSNNATTYGIDANGIKVETSSNNNIFDNVVATNGTFGHGIGITLSSNNNNINSNIITTNFTKSYGLHILSSSNNQVYANSITTTGSEGNGIYVSSSNNNSLYANTITTNASSSHGFYILDGSKDNKIFGNRITSNSSSGSYSALLSQSNHTSFYNNTLYSRSAVIVLNNSGLRFGPLSYINFTNDTIIPCTAGCAGNYQDVAITSNVTDIIFLNVSFNKSRIIFVQNNPDNPTEKNNLTIRWYLDVNVTNSTDNKPIANAQVVINDSFRNNIFNGTTSLTGGIQTLTVTEFEMNGTVQWGNNESCHTLAATHNLTCYSPYNISVNITEYNNYNNALAMNRSKFRNISLTFIPPPSNLNCTNITTAGYIHNLTGNASSYATCINVLANNVIVDCHGFSINYSNTSRGSGINISGYNYTTIRSCKILSSRTLSSALSITENSTNITIYNSTLITTGTSSNGVLISNSSNISISGLNITASGAGAYAILANKAASNLLLFNNIIQGSIGLESGSNNISVYSNNITTTISVGFGILLAQASSNLIYSNNIRTYNVNSHGILARSTSFQNIIYGNNVVTSGSTSYGVAIGLTAYNNTIYRNNLTTLNISSSSIVLNDDVYNNTIFENNLSAKNNSGSFGVYIWKNVNHNNFYRNLIISSSSGIMINGSGQTASQTTSYNYFTNDTIIPCTSDCSVAYNDIIVSANATDNIFINISLNKSRILIAPNNPDNPVEKNNLTVKWYLDVNVTNSTDNKPIANAQVVINDSFRNNIFNGTTSLTGEIQTLTVTEFEMNGTVQWGNNESCHTLAATHNITCYSPYNISVNKSGYNDYNNAFTVNRSKFRNISMSLLPPSNLNCTNITTPGYIHNLTGNASSYATCINVSANNVTIDCKGHWINYSNSSTGYGIVSVYNYTTIRSCNIVQASSDAGSYAIFIHSNSTKADIFNNTISTVDAYGVYLWQQAYNASIHNNRIPVFSSIYIEGNSYNNSVYENFVNTTTSGGISPIKILDSSENYIHNNFIGCACFGGGPPGIGITSSSRMNRVYKNNITVYDPSSGPNVYIESSDNNSVYDNVLTNDESTFRIDIQLGTNNSVYNNYISLTDSATGINDAGSFNSIFANNITQLDDDSASAINLQGSYGNVYGNNIKLYYGSDAGIQLTSTFYNSVYGNTITSNGSASYGIYLASSFYNNIFNNSVTTNGSRSHPFFLNNNIYNNTIYQNNITSKNETGSFGIYLLRDVNNNSFYRNTISSLAAGIVINGSGQTAAQRTLGNTFVNDTIIPCAIGCAANYQDIVLTSNATDITFLNVSFNKSRIAIIPRSPNNPVEKNNLTVKWYLDVNVTNSTDNKPIANAQVVINDSFRNNIFNGTTSLTGGIQTLTVTEFEMNGSVLWGSNESCHTLSATHNVTCYSPYNISMNISGYNDYNNAFAVNRSKFRNISLTFIPPPSNLNCTNITTAGYIHNLTGNANATATCINVRANNVTVDCKGYTINYSQSSSGYGINNSGYNFTIVRGCSIVQAALASTASNAYGIYMVDSAHNATIFNNSIITSGSFSYGLHFNAIGSSNGPYNNSISSNNITTRGFSASGIYFLNFDGNYISGNLIATSASNANGISIQSADNQIHSNNITVSGAFSYGITLVSFANRNNIHNNSVTASGGTSIVGISISGLSNNAVFNNTILTGTDGSHGIQIISGSRLNSVYGNSITTNSTNSYGVYLNSNSYNNTVYGNNITTKNTTNSYGMYLSNNVNNNTFFRNTISSLSIGILINGTGQTANQRTSFNTFINDTIIPCAAGCASNYQDIILTSNVTGIILLNVSFNKSRIIIIPYDTNNPAEKNNLTIKWYLDINVTNSTENNPIAGAQIVINDSFSTNIFNGTTSATGGIQTLIVTEFEMNGTVLWGQNESCHTLSATHNITCYSPYNISVNISGYYNYNEALAVNRSKTRNLSILALGFAGSNCTNISTAGFIYNLSNNINATATCINVLANNVTIDCKGYTINYSQNSSGAGVNISRYNFTTIRSCNIIQNTNNTNSYGVYLFNNVHDAAIYNNTISTQNSTTSYGIYMFTTVYNNSIYGNTLVTMADAIRGSTTINDNRIYGNVITTNGSNALGIALVSTANNNSIFDNNISIKRVGGGISVGTSARGNLVYNNNVTNYDLLSVDSAIGIRLFTSAFNNSVYGNIVRGLTAGQHQILLESTVANNSIYDNIVFANLNDNVGIGIETNAFNNYIYNNNVTCAGFRLYCMSLSSANGNYVYQNNLTNPSGARAASVVILASSNNNSFYKNRIMEVGATSLNTGLLLSGSSNNSIYDNHINTSGLFQDAMSLSSNSYGNLIYRNNITTNGSTSRGIFLNGIVYNNTFYDNSITTVNATKSYGIHMLNNISNNTFYRNRISSSSIAIFANGSGEIGSYLNFNYFINSTIVPCAAGCAPNYADIALAANATDIIFINVSFNKSRISIGDPAGTDRANLTVRWYLDVGVTNSTDSNPISGAQVVINDSFRSNVFNGTTSSAGTIQTLTITEFEMNGSVLWGQNESCHTLEITHNLTCYSPYNVSVNKTGYNSHNESLAVNRSKVKTMTVSIIPGSEPEPEDEEESPGSGSGGSGGGGGGSIVTVENFDISPSTIRIRLYPGENASRQIIVTNKGIRKFSISAQAGLSELLSLSESSLELDVEQAKTLMLHFNIPKSAAPDSYSTILALRSLVEKKVNVIIDVLQRDSIFDVKVTVRNSSKISHDGGEIGFDVDLIKLGEYNHSNVSVYYAIKRIDMSVLSSWKEDIKADDIVTLNRKLKIPEGIAVGNYVVYVNVLYDGKIAASSDLFEVTKKEVQNESISIVDVQTSPELEKYYYLAAIALLIVAAITLYSTMTMNAKPKIKKAEIKIRFRKTKR